MALRVEGRVGPPAPVLPSLSCSIRAFGSPPRGLAFGHPSFADTASGRSRTRGAPSIQRWYELTSAPLFGWLGLSAPLRPLGLGSLWYQYFRTVPCLYHQGISTAGSERGRLASGRPRLGGGAALKSREPLWGLFICVGTRMYLYAQLCHSYMT